MRNLNLRYRKRPVEIEAIQLCWKNWSEVCDFLGNIISHKNPGRSVPTYSDRCGEEQGTNENTPGHYIELTVPTPEGDHIARHGDWIIKGVQGEFYPCKPDIFTLTYEEVPNESE
jgi:hypothetical protein